MLLGRIFMLHFFSLRLFGSFHLSLKIFAVAHIYSNVIVVIDEDKLQSYALAEKVQKQLYQIVLNNKNKRCNDIPICL